MADSTKPRVILGLMTYGPETCKDCRITSMTEFQHHLDVFQKAYGYNEIDTARIYASGEQERFTAEAGWKERGFELATKSYPQIPGAHTPANLRTDLETSLSELGTEQVDIFYLHAADRSVPFTETLKEVNMLYKEGKFKKLGLSNYSAYEVAEIVMICSAKGWVRPTIYQGVYNAIARNLETEVIPACHRYGLDVVIYNPLCGGLLTGRYTSATGDGSGRYDTNTFLGPIYRSMYFNENNFRAIDKIRAAAGKHGLSMTEVALRWCVHHSAMKPAQKGGHDGVIIGVSRAEQLSQNITDLWKDPLPKEVVEALDTAWVIAKGTSPNPWHTPLVYTYDAKNALFDE